MDEHRMVRLAVRACGFGSHRHEGDRAFVSIGDAAAGSADITVAVARTGAKRGPDD
jgi:hypothetical protein